MEGFFAAIISYMLGLASNMHAHAISASREEALKKQLEQDDVLRKALAATRSLRDDIRAACEELAQNHAEVGVTPEEEPLWRLLSNETYQADLTEWLRAGCIDEGNAVKIRILKAMQDVLAKTTANPEQIAFLKTSYFDTVDKAIFSHPALAHWRHQLTLDYLREQVAQLRQRAEEAAGVYSPDKQKAALDRYCEKALAAWDIIDLSNLPEGDVQMATQKLLLRQLYMPLRIRIEPTEHDGVDDPSLARLEIQREGRRRREAGHFVVDDSEFSDSADTSYSVGECLREFRRLVVLGDPGGGKTTMLRWMATAYLLRYRDDDTFYQVPDTQTLTNQAWIPVLIRCRDLGETDLCRSFADFLTQHLNKTELLPEEADVVRAVILDRIAKGDALLLIDGLDEITNPYVRMMFCQELERTAARYPDAPIVVTSRIVGYRDMPYRMGSGFEHGVIAELSAEDKDLFARRWIEVTEQHHSSAEKTRRAEELLAALRSNDRIQRLTGNPMLLTTLALVKRKVGKLPNKRTKLYAEAVTVLLNWNPRLYAIIEEDEALPQLEYLAYEMCRRGVQRLNDDEALDLLDNVRLEYQNVRAIRRQQPQEFLRLLEARSSILIKSGSVWLKDTTTEKPSWEFRHLTFQEYLAARALLDGRYPGRDKTKSLAEQTAPLAGRLENPVSHQQRSAEPDAQVPESWREVLRLLVADCRDDDVDQVVLAILNPSAGEDPAASVRPRAVLAALCLADEPNVSEETAQKVLSALASSVRGNDGHGPARTSLDRAAIELSGSMWMPLLSKVLNEEFGRHARERRLNVGGLLAMIKAIQYGPGLDTQEVFAALLQDLQSGDRSKMLSAALAVMVLGYERRATLLPGLIEALMKMLNGDAAERQAGAWALFWLNGGSSSSFSTRIALWLPSAAEFTQLVRTLETASLDEADLRRFVRSILSNISPESKEITATTLLPSLGSSDADVRASIGQAFGKLGDKQAVPSLIAKLDDPDANVRRAVAEALGKLGDKQAVPSLIAKLDDPDANVRRAVAEALGKLGDKQAVPSLIAKLDDPDTIVLVAVTEALGKLDDKLAVPSLIAKLDNPDPIVLMAVTEALGKLGDKLAVPSLIAKLDNPDPNIRRAITEALGKLDDKRAVPSLIAKLDDPNANVRRAVTEALGKSGDRQSVPLLIAMLDNPGAGVRMAVTETLRRLGDKRAVPSLIAKLNDPDANVRRAVAKAVGKLGDEQAVESLVPLLGDRAHEVCAAAAAALKALGDERGSSALADFLDHESPARRKATVKELVEQRANAWERMIMSRDLDGHGPWLDPAKPITEERIAAAARRLAITDQKARGLYESLAADFHLRFA